MYTSRNDGGEIMFQKKDSFTPALEANDVHEADIWRETGWGLMWSPIVDQ